MYWLLNYISCVTHLNEMLIIMQVFVFSGENHLVIIFMTKGLGCSHPFRIYCNLLFYVND